jgi:hypothetical protein
MRRRPWLATAAALLAAALACGALGSAAAVAAPKELTVGRLKLHPCEDLPGAWCGRLRVPFDRTDPAAGTIPGHDPPRPVGARASVARQPVLQAKPF